MPIGNVDVHTGPHASIFCDCPQHEAARAAHKEAMELSGQILAAKKAGQTRKMNKLLKRLDELNKIARQCD